MNPSESIVLARYRRNRASLTTSVAAKRIWDAERLVERGLLTIDFSGIRARDLSREFINAMFRLDQSDCRANWLKPINYSDEVADMLEPYFLKRGMQQRPVNGMPTHPRSR